MLTRNPIAEAIELIAGTAGREVVVVEEDDGRPRARGDRRARRCGEGDAVVLCDHDAPDAPAGAACRAGLAGVVRRDDGQPSSLRGTARRARATRASPAWRSCTCPRAQHRRQGARRDRAVGGGRDRGGVLRPPRRTDAVRVAALARPAARRSGGRPRCVRLRRQHRGSAPPPRRGARCASTGRPGRTPRPCGRTTDPRPPAPASSPSIAARSPPPDRATWARAVSSATRTAGEGHAARARRRAARSVTSRSRATDGATVCRPEIAASRANRPVPGGGERRVGEPGPQQPLVPARRGPSRPGSARRRRRRPGRAAGPARAGRRPAARAPRCPRGTAPPARRRSREPGCRGRPARRGGSSPVRWATVNIPATQSSTTGSRTARSPASGTRNSPRACGERLLGPGQPGRRGALLDAQVHGGLGDAQPADHAQREHHLGARAPAPRRRRRTAGRAGRPAPRAARRVVHGVHRLLGCQLRRQAREGVPPAVVVDPGALGDADAPRREVVDRRAWRARRAPSPRRRTPRRRPGCPTTPPATRTMRGQAARNSLGWSDARTHARPCVRRHVRTRAASGVSHDREDLAPLDGAAGRHQGGDLAGGRLVLDLDGVVAGDQLAGVGVGAVGVDGVLDLGVALAAASRRRRTWRSAGRCRRRCGRRARRRPPGRPGARRRWRSSSSWLAGSPPGRKRSESQSLLADQVDVGVGHGRSSRTSVQCPWRLLATPL